MLDQKSGGEIQDGMDIALCVIDKQKRELSFSGARNGILQLSNNEFTLHHADLFTVGGSYSKRSREMDRNFRCNVITLKEDDWIFMYTDGYYDQIGGESMMSLGVKEFKTILKEVVDFPQEKDEYLLKKLQDWKGNYPQLDDLLVIGFNL